MTRILVLSGGGSHGSFEMGVVSRLIKDGRGKWDLITGVSAGCINGCYLSTINKEDEIKNLETFKSVWSNLNNSNVYEYEFFLNGLSLYDSNFFKQKIENLFKNKKTVRPILVSATSLSSSESVIFSNDDIAKYGFTDIIMSSTAIPLIFQPHSFLDDMFIDGGFTSNVLFYDAVNYYLNNENNPQTEKISIDIITCGKKIPKETINKDNITFLKLLEKTLGIVEQEVEYSEILKNIQYPLEIDVNVFDQKEDPIVSFLNFDHGEELFNSGFSLQNVHEYNIKI